MTNDLNSRAQEMLPALDEEMRAVLQFDGSQPQPFLGMMHYQMGWVDPQLQPIEPKSGKRIRPLLCLLVSEAAGGSWEQALPAAAAIEIVHNFSLIHDDIEDASPTRRGRPTVWKVWGDAQAINSGDAMFTEAHLALGRLLERGVAPSKIVRASRLFDETCLALTAGQYADMDFETRGDVTVDQYLAMIKGKTAVLLALSAELGALIADSTEETIANYAAFGLNLGLAFQVIDDILGIWGDETKTGKSAATDIVTKKKTLPVLYGLAHCEPLRDLYLEAEADDQFVTEVVRWLDDTGAKQFAARQARDYTDAAVSHLKAAAPQGTSGDALQQLTDMLLKRDM